MSLFKRLKKQPIDKAVDEDLDEVLFIDPTTGVPIKLSTIITSVLVKGEPGSGKTSAIAKVLLMNILKKNMPVFSFCVKTDEADRIIGYANKTGRGNDVIYVHENDNKYAFNFLQYEMTREGKGAGNPYNIANDLMMIYELGKNFQAGSSGGNEDKFWDQALRILIVRCIMLLKLAGLEVSINNLRRIVTDCFEVEDAKRYKKFQAVMSDPKIDKDERLKVLGEYTYWVNENFFLAAFEKANIKKLNEKESWEMQLVGDYFMKSFAQLSEKTRSIVIACFDGLVEPFLSGILKDKFTSGVSEELKPENVLKERKLVVFSYPVSEFGVSALYAAGIYKLVVQRAMQRRNIEKEEDPVVASIFIDEAHNFIFPEYDTKFMAEARSTRTASILITQNLNNIIWAMGSKNPEARAKSWLNNIGLKYFCCNSDHDTNEYASQLLGDHLIDTESVVIKGNERDSYSYSQQIRRKFPPENFTTLKTGRRANNFKVEAIVFKAGMTWDKEGSNYALVEFDQRAE